MDSVKGYQKRINDYATICEPIACYKLVNMILVHPLLRTFQYFNALNTTNRVTGKRFSIAHQNTYGMWKWTYEEIKRRKLVIPLYFSTHKLKFIFHSLIYMYMFKMKNKLFIKPYNPRSTPQHFHSESDFYTMQFMNTK